MAEWYAGFDLVMIGTTDTEFVREIKTINPNTVVVRTIDWNVSAHMDDVPDPLWLLRSDGEHISWYYSSPPPSNMRAGNMSDVCPLYEGQRFNEWFPEQMANALDLTVFDGLATDGLYAGRHINGHMPSDIDLDRNGINDLDEHGHDWVVDHWDTGVSQLINNTRDQVGDDGLILINSGVGFGGHPRLSQINGAVLEYFSSELSWDWNRAQYVHFMETAREPHIALFQNNPHGADPYRPDVLKDYFTFVRFGLTRVMLGDGYYHYQDMVLPNHYYSRYYDEFDLNVGYPTTDMQQLGERDVWIRFFDGGAIIVNFTKETTVVSSAELSAMPGFNGPYYRFRGGQDPTFNNGEPFDSVELFGGDYHDNGLNWYVGDGIILVNEPTTTVADIIIDNDEYTSPGSESAQMSGEWEPWSDASQGHQAYTLRNAPWHELYNYRFAEGGSGASVEFVPTIGVAGDYAVYEWHGIHDEPVATNVSVTVTHADGAEQMTIDMSRDTGGWNLLGAYRFTTGTSGRVVIGTSGADGVVLADAVKLVYLHRCDEDDESACLTSQRCPGHRICGADEQWGACLPQPESAEVCDDGLDNDCNGTIDDPSLCRTEECSLSVEISADDWYVVYVDGVEVGSGGQWDDAESFEVTLEPGAHVLAVSGLNSSGTGGGDNPAGILVSATTCESTFVSDADWAVAAEAGEDWTSVAFDDASWAKASIVAPYGEGVWGQYNGGVVDDFSGDAGASWIWLDVAANDQEAFFRRSFVISPPATEPEEGDDDGASAVEPEEGDSGQIESAPGALTGGCSSGARSTGRSHLVWSALALLCLAMGAARRRSHR